jgi:hypothetical protein
MHTSPYKETRSLRKGERKKQCKKEKKSGHLVASSSRICSGSWLPRVREAAASKTRGATAAPGNHHRAEVPPSRRTEERREGCRSLRAREEHHGGPDLAAGAGAHSAAAAGAGLRHRRCGRGAPPAVINDLPCSAPRPPPPSSSPSPSPSSSTTAH